MKVFTKILILVIVLALVVTPFFQEKVWASSEDFIKWVECRVSYDILQRCYEYDVNSYNAATHYNFIELISYIALKNGNKFNNKSSDFANLSKVIDRLNNGETMQDIAGENKYYRYYLESYQAIFGEFVGYYYNTMMNELQYGLRVYHPIAKGYWHTGSDDFGNSRSYGFRRRHLGHDLFGSVGTPIIAVEGGRIAEIGWNRYGGWRIGIRSDDTKRYYYYAHLRKGHPYNKDLKAGDQVEAGEVIGYLGVTGYSYRENVNMKTKPHLHFGMQLIFDESQVDGNEIWIDVYNIARFLTKNKAHVIKDEKDYNSIYLRKSVNWHSNPIDDLQ